MFSGWDGEQKGTIIECQTFFILGALYMLSPLILPATCEIGNNCVTDEVFGAERS